MAARAHGYLVAPLARSRPRPPAEQEKQAAPVPRGPKTGAAHTRRGPVAYRALAGLQLLHRAGPRFPLGEALLGLQQPMNHDQLVHGGRSGRPDRVVLGLLAEPSTFYSAAVRTAFGVRGRVAVTVVPWPGREWTCQLPPAISSCWRMLARPKWLSPK
jgi:hypothetical protein